MSVVGIGFHDVPENRLAPDRHHWLRAKLRFLAQPRAFPSAQNNDLHPESRFPLTVRFLERTRTHRSESEVRELADHALQQLIHRIAQRCSKKGCFLLILKK